MAQRVLSTEEARTAIQQMQSILSTSFESNVQNLINVGNTLSQPDVWDGPVAARFRGDWQRTSNSLNQALTALKELGQQISSINENIMQAGGN